MRKDLNNTSTPIQPAQMFQVGSKQSTSAIISSEGRNNKRLKFTLMGYFPKTLISEPHGANSDIWD